MIRHVGKERIAEKLSAIPGLTRVELIGRWRSAHGQSPPRAVGRRLLEHDAAYQVQAKAFGGLKPATRRKLARIFDDLSANREPAPHPVAVKPGTRLLREWQGVIHEVVVEDGGVRFRDQTYRSLSAVAREITGARWSGPRFFGLNGKAP